MCTDVLIGCCYTNYRTVPQRHVLDRGDFIVHDQCWVGQGAKNRHPAISNRRILVGGLWVVIIGERPLH